jgi:hypothetical protein
MPRLLCSPGANRLPLRRASRRRLARLTAIVAALVTVATTAAVGSTFPVASKTLTAYKSCTLTATTSTSTAMVDTDVRQATATSNFGTQTTMTIATGTSANRRAYLRYDLTKCSPVIPTTASVKLATIRLFVTTLPASCRTYDIFDVTAAWTETAITWNNQPFGTTLNNPASATKTSSINVGPSGCQNATANSYVSGWDVTVDAQNFVSGAQTNNGWMIRDDVENFATATTNTLSTKDANTLARGPQLVITYTT